MRRILIFFSDTGGGHRAAANALRDGFRARAPDQHEIIFIDGFKECAPFPLNHIPATYFPLTTYTPWLWRWLFRSSNLRVTLPLSAALDDLILRKGCARVIRQHNPDLVISVHPLINRPPCNALKAFKPTAPFVTVVTDLFDAHGMWFSAASDLLIVPTQGAYERGVFWNFPKEKMRVIGQPIALKFATPPKNEPQEELRARLGLQPNGFTILLVGGGEGMGPLHAIARALNDAQLPLQLVIIAGRNESLRAQLQKDAWAIPVNIQGFVTNMPDWMRASDLVITKAGPGTIMETLAAGKPMILYGYLPGQEEGNVTFVEKNQVGVLQTTPTAIASQVREWLNGDRRVLAELKANAQRAARPDATIEIVKAIEEQL
ncbi:MAG TPA: glycosyltransferase [Anaerolineae bacterium]|nr:glycosyltransferase [Anaerolineae bacterium]